jgi:hypothetical protein
MKSLHPCPSTYTPNTFCGGALEITANRPLHGYSDEEISTSKTTVFSYAQA